MLSDWHKWDIVVTAVCGCGVEGMICFAFEGAFLPLQSLLH